MKKLLFASLLTVAVMFGATITLDDAPAPAKKPGTTKARKRNTKSNTESTGKSGSGGHVGGGSGAGKVSGVELPPNFGVSSPKDSAGTTKTGGKKPSKKTADVDKPDKKLADKERRK